jgi:hypothetical protein
MHLRSLALISPLSLVILLSSCAESSVKKTWKSPDYNRGPITKVAVLAIDERGDVRQALENRLVTQIRKDGATAIPSHDLLSLSEINQDKPAAAARLRAAGAEAILIMKLVDVATSYRESRPAPERYAEVITGFETGTWYDYYSVAFMDLSPTYGNLKQKVYLESALFDLATAKRLWSGTTLTVVGETTDRVAEADVLVAKIMAAMRKDGMIP